MFPGIADRWQNENSTPEIKINAPTEMFGFWWIQQPQIQHSPPVAQTACKNDVWSSC